MHRTLLAATLVIVGASAGCQKKEETTTAQETVTRAAAQVDDARLLKADSDPANWVSYGRNYAEQRFAPLDKINTRT